MTLEQPPRLKDGQELGAVLRAADRVKVSPERLADNAARVKALIAAGATTALWKLLLPLVLLLAISVPLVAPRLMRDEPHRAGGATSAVAFDAGLGSAADAAVAIIEPEAADAGVASELPAEAHKRPERVAAAQPDAGLPDAPAPSPSELPEQIRLYESAREAAKVGDFGRGINQIDELLRRFPATQLRAEAELTRAELLARDLRLPEAAQALEALVGDAAHGGRRGELLRTLGDLYRQQHDCKRAVDAFTRALAEHLSERDRADAERGRDHCTVR